jgi:hypothetical protein
VAGIQAFGGGSTPSNLLGDGANSPVSGFQKDKEPNTQSNTTEQQFSDGVTTEERLKSSQSPLDQFLSDTSHSTSSVSAQKDASQSVVQNDRKEDDNQPNAAVIGRSAARSRDNYVGAQTQQVTDAVNKEPLKAYDSEVYRHVETRHAATYSSAHYGSPGRYNRVGESTLYTSESMKGLELEASRYPGVNDPSGLAGRTVTKSQFTGNVIDGTQLPNVTEGALTEGYGKEGSQRSTLSIVTGEDPYTHPRAISDAARARGADAVRVPAGEETVHVGVLPENVSNPAGQLQYRSHFDVDASGTYGPVQNTPGSIAPPPAASLPNIHNPGAPDHNPTNTAEVIARDSKNHTRAGGVRYGAAGGFAVSSYQALSDGQLTKSDAVNVATGTGLGAGAALVDDALTKGMGGSFTAGVKAGGIVDGVVSAGTSVYSNAQAYDRGEISAADATADVIVDTGVGVASGLAGAAAGAAIGSVIPVAGTAVGAAIGFGVGMIASWGTSKVLEDSGAADWAREGLGDALEDNKEGMLEKGWSTVSSWFN